MSTYFLTFFVFFYKLLTSLTFCVIFSDMLGEKIKKIVRSKGISQTEAAKMLGMKVARFNGWCNNQNDISSDVIKQICEKFNITPNFLFDVDNEYNLPPDIVKIDVLDVSACCGNGITNISENVIGHQFVSKNLLKEFTFTSPENIKIIRAVGDSMIPTINPQDMIWIDMSVKEPSSDGLYLLTVGQDLMIKRIQINPFNNQVQVKSDNPAYAPILLNDYKEISCIGKVIYHMKRVG